MADYSSTMKMGGYRRFTKDPDKWERSEGGGFAGLIGLPFFLAGILILLGAAGLIPVENRDQLPWWGGPAMAIMAAAFVGVGSWIMFGKRGASIDRALGRVVIWKSLLWWRGSDERDLSRFNKVSLRRDEGDSDSADSFPVELIGQNDRVRVFGSTDYAASRRTAVELALFLDMPLENSCFSETETIPPERAALNLVQRTREAGDMPYSPPPEKGLAQVEEGPGWLRISLKERPLRPLQVAGTLVPPAIYGFLVYQFGPWLIATKTPPGVRAAMYVALGLVLVFLPLAGLVKKALTAYLARTEIKAGNNVLDVYMKGVIFEKQDVIRTGDIIDLQVTGVSAWSKRDKHKPSAGIIARTADREVSFAIGVSMEEAEYLRSIILAKML